MDLFFIFAYYLNFKFFFSSPFFIHGSELQQMKQKHVIINEFHCVVRNKKISLYFDIFRSYNEKRVGLKFHSLAEWINILSHIVLSKKNLLFFSFWRKIPCPFEQIFLFDFLFECIFFSLSVMCHINDTFMKNIYFNTKCHISYTSSLIFPTGK